MSNGDARPSFTLALLLPKAWGGMPIGCTVDDRQPCAGKEGAVGAVLGKAKQRVERPAVNVHKAVCALLPCFRASLASTVSADSCLSSVVCEEHKGG